MTISVRALISGKVQGVWYRQSTLEISCGEVEVLFEGEDEAVEAALKWCEEGPPLSKVSKVERFHEEPKGIKPPFEIWQTI